MTPVKGSGAGYYVCVGHAKKPGSCPQRYTRIDAMESRIDSLLGSEFASPSFLRSMAQQMQSSQGSDKRATRIQHLETEQKSLERKRHRIIEMYSDGDISRLEKDEKLAKIAEQLATVTEELTRIQGSAPAGTTLEQLVTMFSVFAGWDTYSAEGRRRLLALYVPRMRVRDGQVVSVYRLLDGQETRYDSKCSRS